MSERQPNVEIEVHRLGDEEKVIELSPGEKEEIRTSTQMFVVRYPDVDSDPQEAHSCGAIYMELGVQGKLYLESGEEGPFCGEQI